MKTLTKTLLTAAGLMLGVTVVNAQTTYNGTPANDIKDGANWSNGLPSSTNLGTININSDWVTVSSPNSTTLTGWHVNLTGGTLGASNTGGRIISGGVWGLSGGNIGFSNRNLSVNDSAQMTVNSGSTLTVGGGLNVNSGSTLTLSGGAISAPAGSGGSGHFNINGTSGNFTMNSGSVTAGGNFGQSNASGNVANGWNFNGGTLTASTLQYRSLATMTLGGTTAGSATFTNGYATSNHSDDNIRIDWLSGSLMTLTIGATDWAETNWAAGRMTYFDGTNTINNTNYSWAQVTTTGFGDGNRFDWSGTNNTLALVVIPEPSTLVLFGIAGLAALGFLRRRK
jgi:hypothetical protein